MLGHVWFGAEIGWIGFDPTTDLLIGNYHIVLAWAATFPTFPRSRRQSSAPASKSSPSRGCRSGE